MELNPEEISALYPGRIFIVKQPDTRAIQWKLRPESKVIFILHESEFNNKALTELLKKIADYAELGKGVAGFGIIQGKPTVEDWKQIPGKLAIVFDDSLMPGTNPWMEEEKRVWFSRRLSQLKDSVPDKKILQGWLNEIKVLAK